MTAYARQLQAAATRYDNMSPPEDEPGLLDDYVEAREFIADEHSEAFTEDAFDLVEEWISGPQDKFAEAKALRRVKELANRYVEWCEAEDERRRRDGGL